MAEDDTGQALASKFRRLAELRITRDITKIAAEDAEREFRACEADIWDDLIESPIEGSITIDLGEPHGKIRFSPRETIYADVIDEDALMGYFENRALVDEYTGPGLKKARVNALAREHFEQKKSFPPGLSFRPQRGITMTKLKK